VRETFEEYVTARGAALLRFAFVLSGDHHRAEDVVQEVLSRLHGRWRRLEGVEQPDAYVRRAIVREYLAWRRRLGNRETPLAVPPERAGPDAADRLGDRDEMWRLLARLPRTQRAVLVLRYYEDLTDAQIADVLGCRATTVRVHASRAFARLRPSIRPIPQPIGGEGKQ
jgi:RNA polymerase sigma-70 factor (sigma-E family)